MVSESEGHLALIKELLAGLVHLATREIVNGEAIDNLPVATSGNLAGERVHDSLWDTVRVTVADDGHAGPLIANSAKPEVVDVVAGSSGS